MLNIWLVSPAAKARVPLTGLPELDEERPGLGGSTNRRGLGWVPRQPIPEGV